MPGGMGGMPGAGAGPGGAQFRYSGVDPEAAQRIFESLFGGGGAGGLGGLFGGMGGGGASPGGMGGAGGPRRRVHVFSSGPRGPGSMFGASSRAGTPGTPPSPGVAFGMDESDEEGPFGFGGGGYGGPFGGGMGGGMGGMGGGMGARAPPPAAPDVQQVPLKLTLEELYKGATKVRAREE